MAEEDENYEYSENNEDNSDKNKAAYVAKGSYGCVVKPALENEVEGVKKQYPGDVSKLFKDQDNYDDAIEASDKAYTIMERNEGHKVHVYSKKFRASNLRKNTRKACKFLGHQKLYPVRMKNLGKDIGGLETYYKEVRKIPFETVFEQIVKVFHQVYLAHKAGYIHGDIRQTNIMVDPKTGILTLIDFDWFKPKKDFFYGYQNALGFYSNPPESLVYWKLEESTISSHAFEEKQNSYRVANNTLRVQDITRSEMADATASNVKYLMEVKEIGKVDPSEQYKALQEVLFDTFDSYGLGITMQYFVNIMYPKGLKERISRHGVAYKEKEIKVIEDIVDNLKGLLERMSALKLERRLVIKDTYAMIKELFDECKTKLAATVTPVAPAAKSKTKTPSPPKAPPSSPVSSKRNRMTRRRRQ